MQEHELSSLISQASILMEQFERNSSHIQQQLHQLAHAVHGVTQQLPAVLKQSADGSLQTLPAQVINKVKDGLERPVADYQQRLHAAVSEAGSSTHAFSQQLQRMERLHHWLIWKVVGVVGGSLALLFAGGLWLSMHYTKIIQENQLDANLLKAYNAADVRLCGDGRLCANVDIRGKRYGDRQQYFLVESR